MTGVRQWVFSLCAAGVVSAMIQALSPKSSLSKLMQTVCALFMLLCILMPLSKLAAMPAELLKNLSRLERAGSKAPTKDLGQDIYLQSAKDKLEALVADKLRKMGINPLEVRINITMSGDEIAVGDVELLLPHAARGRHDDIRSRLEGELGLTVKIGYQ